MGGGGYNGKDPLFATPPQTYVPYFYLMIDYICNGTCSVTGGTITYWGGAGGGHKRNRSGV